MKAFLTLFLTLILVTGAAFLGYKPIAGPITLPIVENPPALVCELLVGDDQVYRMDPRPQVGCYSDKVGIFFWNFWDGDRWVGFQSTTWPGKASGYMFSVASEVKVVFVSLEGETAETQILAENTLFDRYCRQPLCLGV